MRPALALPILLAAAFPPAGRAADTGRPAGGGPVPARRAADTGRPAGGGPAPAADRPGSGQLPAGHPPVPGAPSSQELLAQVEAMKAELQRRPKTVEIESALGTLYLANGRILDAIDWYRQALETAEPWRKRWEALPAAARRARPPEPARAACARSSRLGSSELAALAEARLAAGDQAGGAWCLGQALEPSLEALSRRGNAWFLAGNPDQGVADHEEVLRRDPARSDSLYFIGAIFVDSAGEDLERLRRAREAWLELRRRDPRSPRLAAVAEALPALEARIAGGGKGPAPAAAAPQPGRTAAGAPPVAAPVAAPPASPTRVAPPVPVPGAAGPPAPARPAAPATAPAPAAGAASPRELAARGDAAFQAGDYAGAAAAWKQVVSADPWLAGELRLHARIAEAESRLPARR